mgnify:CR=1 FL=1
MTDEKAELLEQLLIWWHRLHKTSNKKFFPLFWNRSRYLVLMGGGGSGKSIFAGRKILERAISEPEHRFLVCRKVAKTLKESCFRQLLTQLSEFYSCIPYTVSKTEMKISFKNGSEILFVGLDDVEKLKSIYNITGIWIEEASEISESDFNQLDIRLRGRSPFYKQIIISFNPVSVMHWLKKRFFDKQKSDVTVHRSTYLDNRFLDDAAKRVLENYRDTDEYYYQVYALGQWGTTGRTVFCAADIADRLSEIGLPRTSGMFEYDYDGQQITNIRFSKSDDGWIKLYCEPREISRYVIGADTAGDGSDFFVAQVLDADSGEQVAVLRQSMDADIFARQLYCLGKFYNDALIGVETNFNIYPVYELERLGYPNQYVRESVDNFTHQPKKSYGFVTTSKTRPLILSELIRIMREGIRLIWDEDTLSEMLTFVRRDNMRLEAEAGAHDDCVMSLAIAYYIRPCQQNYVPENTKHEYTWTPDMWEDYRSADRNTREYLIKKWGKPKYGE